MKLKKYLLLLPFVALGLVGCTSETSDDPEQNEPTSGEEPTVVDEPTPEEPVVETVTYTVTWEASEDFTIEGLETSYEAGATVLFTVTVTNEGKELSEVAWNSTIITADNAGVYSFTMPEENVVLTVTLVTLPPSLSDWLANFSDPSTMSYKMESSFTLVFTQVDYDSMSGTYTELENPNVYVQSIDTTVLAGNGSILIDDDTLYTLDEDGYLVLYTCTDGVWTSTSYSSSSYTLANVYSLYYFNLYSGVYTLFEETTENGVYTLTSDGSYYASRIGFYYSYYSYYVGTYFTESTPTLTLEGDHSATIKSEFTDDSGSVWRLEQGSTDRYVLDEGSGISFEITNVGTTTVDVDAILGNS